MRSLTALLVAAAFAQDPSPAKAIRRAAYAEPDLERRGQMLFEASRLMSDENIAYCPPPGNEPCRAIGARLSQYHTAAVRWHFADPRPQFRQVACAPGEASLACLRRALGSDWLGSDAVRSPDPIAFASAKRLGGERVQVVIGEAVPAADGTRLELMVISDDIVWDPILAAMEVRPQDEIQQLGSREPLGRDGFVVLAGATTLRTNRALRPDEAVLAVCDDRVVRVDHPRLKAIGIDEIEEVGSGVMPVYIYALPCAAHVVVSANVAGIAEGPYVRTPIAAKAGEVRTTAAGPVTIVEAPEGRCTMEAPGASLRIDRKTCELQFVGDLNGDGRADAVFRESGEMGCGSFSLFLSEPTGWSAAAFSIWFC